jgi:hypothetical protein
MGIIMFGGKGFRMLEQIGMLLWMDDAVVSEGGVVLEGCEVEVEIQFSAWLAVSDCHAWSTYFEICGLVAWLNETFFVDCWCCASDSSLHGRREKR